MAAKKKFTRVTRDVPTVTFTLPDVYGDAEFELPNATYTPLEFTAAVQRTDITAILAWFENNGVDEATLDAIADLNMEEFLTFSKAWGKASKVSVPKS